MRFIDLLRKLGVFRFGTKTGTYTSAKDMPAEFLMNDVFNADKDLVTKQDIKKAVSAGKAAEKKGCIPSVLIALGVFCVILNS